MYCLDLLAINLANHFLVARVINFQIFPAASPKINTAQFEELGFSKHTQVRVGTTVQIPTTSYSFSSQGECTNFELRSERVDSEGFMLNVFLLCALQVQEARSHT